MIAPREMREAVLDRLGERGEEAAHFGDPRLALQFVCGRAGRLRTVAIDARVPEERARRLVAALRRLGSRLCVYRIHARDPAPGRPVACTATEVRLVAFAQGALEPGPPRRLAGTRAPRSSKPA